MPNELDITIEAIGIGGLNSGVAATALRPEESPNMTNFTVIDGILQKRTGYADNSGEVGAAKSTVTQTATTSATDTSTQTATQTATDTATQTATISTTGTDTASTTASASVSKSISVSTSASVSKSTSDSLSATTSASYSQSGSATGETPASSAKFFHGHHYQDGVSGIKRFWIFGEDIRFKDAIGDNWHDGAGSSEFATSMDDYWFNTTEVVELDDYKNYMIVNQADTKRVGGTFKKVCYTNSPTNPLALLLGANGYNASAGSIYHYCKRVLSFDDHLLLFHTYEEANANEWVEFFQRFRWSNTAHFTASEDWDDNNTTGAGYQDIKTDFGSILNADVLISHVCIYMDKGIVACYRTGTSSAPFYIETKIPGLGLYAPRLLANNGTSHFFVGTDENIYRYYGGTDIEPIGDKIKTEFFSNLNRTQSGGYAYADRAWAFVLQDIEAVIFAIPTGSGNIDPTLFYIYFWRERRWERWDYADTICGMGNYERPASTAVSNMPIFSDGEGWAYQLDYSSTNDDATAIDASVETYDVIVDLKSNWRTGKLWYEASGDGAASSVRVAISTDGGATFTDGNGGADGTYQTDTIGTGWDCYILNFNTTGYVNRFKFRNLTASQKLKLRKMRYILQQSEIR
jgi:hypothetical protein